MGKVEENMFWAKKNKPGHERDERIPHIDGMHYYDVLEKSLSKLSPIWYLEIGTRNGRSLSKCSGNFISIDPEFKLTYDIVNSASQMYLYQGTSDDFFKSNFLTINGIKPGVAFIDGMHLFEFVLRDFINCERNMSPHSVIFMHDVCPYNLPQTTRDISYMTELGRPWTGDVWKIVPILQKYRPDLRIDVLSAATTGFASIRNLDPQNKVLIDNYEEIFSEFVGQDLSTFGLESYYGSFQLVSPEMYITSLTELG